MKSCLSWRLKNDVDSAFEKWRFSEISKIKQNLAFDTRHGWDKNGHPLYLARPGLMGYHKIQPCTQIYNI